MARGSLSSERERMRWEIRRRKVVNGEDRLDRHRLGRNGPKIKRTNELRGE